MCYGLIKYSVLVSVSTTEKQVLALYVFYRQVSVSAHPRFKVWHGARGGIGTCLTNTRGVLNPGISTDSSMAASLLFEHAPSLTAGNSGMGQTSALTSVNSLMLMLLAFCDSFLRTSSRAKPIFGCTSTGAGRLATEPRGSSEAREPVLHRAAVMVAAGTEKASRGQWLWFQTFQHERSTKQQNHTDIFLVTVMVPIPNTGTGLFFCNPSNNIDKYDTTYFAYCEHNCVRERTCVGTHGSSVCLRNFQQLVLI